MSADLARYDITFCFCDDCPVTECFRHRSVIADRPGCYSMADFSQQCEDYQKAKAMEIKE